MKPTFGKIDTAAVVTQNTESAAQLNRQVAINLAPRVAKSFMKGLVAMANPGNNKINGYYESDPMVKVNNQQHHQMIDYQHLTMKLPWLINKVQILSNTTWFYHTCAC